MAHSSSNCHPYRVHTVSMIPGWKYDCSTCNDSTIFIVHVMQSTGYKCHTVKGIKNLVCDRCIARELIAHGYNLCYSTPSGIVYCKPNKTSNSY